jgi:PAS domain S-box-containing protein
VDTRRIIHPDLRAVLDHSPAVQLLVSRDGIVQYVNRAGAEYFAEPAGEIIGRRAGDLIDCLYTFETPEGCPAGETCAQCPLRRALLETLTLGSEHRRIEIRRPMHLRGHGRNVTLQVSTALIHIAAVPMVLLSIEDLSAWRATEDRLREQTALLAETHEAICVSDLEGRIQFWNRGAERLYGRTAEEAIGADVSNLMFGGSRAPWAQLRQVVLEDGSWDGEVQQFHQNSQSLLVELRGTLIRGAGADLKTILLVGTDVTEKRQLERQVLRGQRLESLGTLACGIAHDLNNVLTPVQMVADLLQGTVAGTEAARFLELLSRSARRGSEVVKQLLAFGRGTEGSRTGIDLRALIKETGGILSETFPKSIRIRVDLSPALWPALGDPTQIHQVILNLCLNARDAMPKGGTLTLSAQNLELDREALRSTPDAQPGPYVVIQVTDTGTGISPELQERIFEPFFTTKPQGQGRGLGLSTALAIVRSHNGFVRVLSRVGSGSHFRVYLPAEHDSLAESSVITPSPVTPAQRRCVLVAEDEDAIRELVKTTLERAGYRVLTAADGAEAVSIFGRQASEISAVVMDMMMPFIDGPAAIAMFRRFEPSIPILAVSGLPAQREEAERASGRRVLFLQKPFQMRELLNQLDQCLQPAPESPTTD